MRTGVFLVLLLAGCAGTLEKSISACYGLQGSPSWTKAGDVEKFECALARW